jgi:pentatricopeptide repeat protein
MRVNNVPLSSYTYVALLHSCTSHAQVRLVKEMLTKDGAELTVPMHIAVLMMCGDLAEAGDASQIVVALNIFNQMREAAKPGLLPESAYNAAISVCGRGGDVQKALGVYDSMLSDGLKPREDTYNAIITACQRSGSLRHAMRMFADISQSEVRAERALYNSLISACAKGMDWMLAEEVCVLDGSRH